MPSESPFDRWGAPLPAPTPPLLRRALTGAINETPFHLSHKMVREWRRWRELLESSEITTPFELAGPRASIGIQAYDFVTPAEDLFDGIAPTFFWCSSAWPETFRVVVESDGPDYLVTPKTPDGASGWNSGTEIAILSTADFDAEPIRPRVFALYGTETQMESVEFEMTNAVWDVLRDTGDTLIKLNLRPARSEVVMPRRTLGLGRGE